MCFHGRTMRFSRAFVIVVVASGLVLSACASEEAVTETSATPSESVSPSQSPSPEATSSFPEEPSREVSFAPVDAGMLGMHMAGAQDGAWFAANTWGFVVVHLAKQMAPVS